MPATTANKNGHSLDQLRESILNEMRIKEVGIHTNSLPSPAVKTSFLTQTQVNKQEDTLPQANKKGVHTARDPFLTPLYSQW